MKTIRARLLLLLLVGLAAVLSAGGTAVYWIEEASLLRQFDATLENRAQLVASLLKQEPQGTVFEHGDAPVAIMAETYFEIRLHAGVMADQTELRGPQAPDLDEDEEEDGAGLPRRLLAGDVVRRSAILGSSSLPAHAPDEGMLYHDDVSLPDDLHGRAAWYAFRPRIDEDDWEGRSLAGVSSPLLVVAVALDREPVDRALATLLGTLIVVGTIVGLTAGLLVLLGVRWGLRPLDRLRDQLGGVSGATISRRLEDAGAPGELIPIYGELNRMLDRVERTIQRERSFADAAAHELRTPLAELRSTAEVAIRWPDAERATAALRELLAIGGEMERLVESLLIISRGSTADGARTVVEVPVLSVLNGYLERADDLIRTKDLQLTVELREQDTLRGTTDAVEIIVRNLIDNAIRYTPDRGSIIVRDGHMVNDAHVLIVENGPVELSEEDVDRMFDPFWQARRSRSDRSHVGLGLSVVQQVAGAVGLLVEATLEGDRLRMQVVASS